MREFDHDELRSRVDEVLYYVWDPIGVSDSPSARGEYSSYVPAVLKLVEEDDTMIPIALYLNEIITNQMGLTPNKKECDNVAQLLLEHKRAIKEGLY